MSRVVLKPGREKSLLRRHPWIFSGAIETLPSFVDGDILPVYSSDGKMLASAYFHSQTSIAGRVISFGSQDPLEAISEAVENAYHFRKTLNLTSYRLINGEGDFIPGLIVDRYNDVLVMQIHTKGIDRLRDFILKKLIALTTPLAIYEKSLSPARELEGLQPTSGWLYGAAQREVAIIENGITYLVSPEEGQKTGFFLDQRLMREAVSALSSGKKVLNCFAYTGGFALAALKGGATLVDSVEISEEACALAKKQTLPNHNIICADVFEFLKTSPLNYDLVILDPPAFAKKRSDVDNACRGYKEINRRVFEKIPPKSYLVTCSCSSVISRELFQNIVSQAAMEAGRFVKIVGSHILSPDHPISLDHPEGDYLKGLILYTDK
jgi:23S rRNA (cytosine1962-C5)-methyltransferase